MSTRLFACLDCTPSFDEICRSLEHLGFIYRHSLPADDRWEYPMHVFGSDSNIRVVYHEGSSDFGEAVVDTTTRGDSPDDWMRLRLVLNLLVTRYGGSVLDPRRLSRGLT